MVQGFKSNILVPAITRKRPSVAIYFKEILCSFHVFSYIDSNHCK